MAAPKRSKIQIEKDREKMAELYLQGYTQRQISKKMNLALCVVNRDLKAVQEWWRQRTAINLDERKQQKLAEIDLSRREAWAGWYRSQEEFKARTTSGKPVQQINSKGEVIGESLKIASQVIHTETRVGDPRFLEQINKCIERECKLLGLDAPQKIKGNVIIVDTEPAKGVDENNL